MQTNINRILLSISSNNNSNKNSQVYSDVILGLFEPNGSLKNAKTSIGGSGSSVSSLILNTRRSITSQSVNLKKKSKYPLKPKSATVYTTVDFKTVIKGKNEKQKIKIPSKLIRSTL